MLLSIYSLYDGSAEPFLDYLCVLVHREDHREREAILSRQETAHLLAQRRRQHWNSTLNEIDTRCSLPGIAVKGSVGLDEVRYICDVHAYIVCAVLVGLDRNGVVEVFGVLWINSKGTLISKVLANFELALRDAASRSVKRPYQLYL